MVFVISKSGKPLMPCKNVIARLLLKDKKAKVVRIEPFTIKLNYTTTEYTQPMTLGIDIGSGIFGAAALNDKNEVVYASEITVRNDIKTTMDQRRAYRRTRRSRKTRYRKPRFLNRKNSIRKDRFSPTIVSKIHSHEKEIEFVKSILPITTLVIETGTFDPHLLKNPVLANPNIRHWGYQKGTLYGYQNVRHMVLTRDKYSCKICRGKKKDSKLEVHHIIFKSNNGSDDPSNLITLCHTCHVMLHHGQISTKMMNTLPGKTNGKLKYATQMNSIRKQILKKYPDAIETFRYITKTNRQTLGLKKTHFIDASVVASGGDKIILPEHYYVKKSVPHGEYKQTKGQHSEIKLNTGKICGYRRFDKVEYMNSLFFVYARRKRGDFDLRKIDMKEINFSYLPRGFRTPKAKDMKRKSARRTVLIEKQKCKTAELKCEIEEHKNN